MIELMLSFFHLVHNLHFLTSSGSGSVMKTMKNDLLKHLVGSCLVLRCKKCEVCKQIFWSSEKMNVGLLKSHILYINILNMKHCCWCIVHLRVVYCSTPEHRAAKWRKLKRHHCLIKCLSMRHCGKYLSRFNLFNKAPIDDRCFKSKRVNHISHHVFKCSSGPLTWNF